MKAKMTIGIIGTGRFANVLVALFSRDRDVIIKQSSQSKPVDGKSIFTLSEVALCDVIIPAVPISALKHVLINLAAVIPVHHSPLVMSVCSVMSKPEEWMLEALPKQVDILVTHPVFGPDSTQHGVHFAKLPLVLSPVRVADQSRVKALREFFKKQDITLMSMTSNEHDVIMSRTQFISFLFGRIGIELNLKQTPLDTRGFALLLENQAIVANDSRQLFIDLCTYNPYALQQFRQIKHLIDHNLEEVDK